MKRPGVEITKRPLHFYWIADCSGSMSLDGRIQRLNSAIRESLPFMRDVAQENPHAELFVRTLRFSHGARWHTPLTAIESFQWSDLIADELDAKPGNTTDIVFLVDTSGSMGDEIDAVKKSCVSFAERIIQEGANVRLGLVGFDIGGHSAISSGLKYKVHNLQCYTIGIWKLTDPLEFKANVASLSIGLFGGGGCYLANSDSVDIFPHVATVFGRSSDSNKILVVISDEIGSREGVGEITKILKSNEITAHVMGVPGQSFAHEEIAQKTGGLFWDIMNCTGTNDFNGILINVADAIAKEVAKKLSDGRTSLGTDMGAAMNLLSHELTIPPMPARALPPVVVLVSDGEPTDNFSDALQRLLNVPWAKKAVRLAIAIGDDANTDVLQAFIGHPEIKPLRANNAEQLAKYIRWMSTVVVGAVSKPTTKVNDQNTLGFRFPDFNEKDIAKKI